MGGATLVRVTREGLQQAVVEKGDWATDEDLNKAVDSIRLARLDLALAEGILFPRPQPSQGCLLDKDVGYCVSLEY